MPRDTVRPRWFRAAASGAIGALIFVIPSVHAASRAHEGLAGERATEVMPPTSTHIAPSTGLYATACTSPGFCVAGGDYQYATKPVEPVVATQYRGRWLRSTPLVLPPGAARQPYSEVNGIACVTAGNCVAVGDYESGGSNSLQAFIATQLRGTWRRAFMPRLPAGAASPASAQLDAVTCASSGFCEAVGSYQDSSGNVQTMALTRLPTGAWRQAAEVASPPGAAGNPDAFMTGVACTAPGSCVAVGNYSVSSSRFAAMGAIESRGVWHRATQIFTPRNAIPSTFTAISSISCPANGACIGVGEYAVSAIQSRAMSVTESNGRFGRAVEITTLPTGGSVHPSTYLQGVSCVSATSCLAVGGGRNAAGHSVALDMTLYKGHWRAAFLPSPPRAGTGSHELSALYAVSCAGRDDECTAVGYYHDTTGTLRAEAASTS
jgi:hypothetical protein